MSPGTPEQYLAKLRQEAQQIEEMLRALRERPATGVGTTWERLRNIRKMIKDAEALGGAGRPCGGPIATGEPVTVTVTYDAAAQVWTCTETGRKRVGEEEPS